MNIRVKVACISLVLLLGGVHLHAQNHEAPEIFRAAEVARRDFALRLEEGSAMKWKYSAYVSDISNYNVGISENNDGYTVVFLLKKIAVKIKGGGGEYKVSKGNLKITRFLGYK